MSAVESINVSVETNSSVQRDAGLFCTVMYYRAAAEGALFNENHITAGQLITPM